MTKTDKAAENAHNKQTTSRQLVVAVFILGLASNMFLQPIFLIRATGRDAYIALAVHSAIDIAALAIFLVTMKLSPDADIFTLLERTVGRIAARIIAAAMGLFFFFKVNICIAETVSFYSDSVFAGTDTTLMAALMLVFFVAAANRTLRALSRMSELVAPLVAVCLAVLITIVAVTGFDLANIFPAMRTGTLGDAMLHHAAWIGDFTPLALFLGRTKLKKRTAVFAAAGGVTAAAIAVFFAIVMCAAFGNVSDLVDTTTNLASVLQYSTGNVFGRIDLIAVIVWSMASFIEGAILFYCASRCFEYAAGHGTHFVHAAIMAAAALCLQIFALSDPTVLTVFTANLAASAVTAAFTVAVPVMSLVCAAAARRAKSSEGAC